VTQNNLSQQLIKSLEPLALSQGITVEQLHQQAEYWFWNRHSNLRLTAQGHQFLKSRLGLDSYHFKLEQPLTNRQLIKLIKYCQGPFYIRGNEVWLYSQSDSVFLILNNNNIDGL
jgi:hypothetical protein